MTSPGGTLMGGDISPGRKLRSTLRNKASWTPFACSISIEARYTDWSQFQQFGQSDVCPLPLRYWGRRRLRTASVNTFSRPTQDFKSVANWSLISSSVAMRFNRFRTNSWLTSSRFVTYRTNSSDSWFKSSSKEGTHDGFNEKHNSVWGAICSRFFRSWLIGVLDGSARSS